MCPARPREQHIFPSLEGCRRRIRLLRVLSHSHGGVMFCMEKQSGLRKKTRCANRAQVFVSAVVRCVYAPSLGFSSLSCCVFTILSERLRLFKLYRRFCAAARGFFALRIL